MLNEPDGTRDEPQSNTAVVVQRPTAPADKLRSTLRDAVDQVFDVEWEDNDTPAPVTATYTGRLRIDSAAAYEQLDNAFKEVDHLPIFAPAGERHLIRAVRG